MAKIASQTKFYSVTVSKLVKNNADDTLAVLEEDIPESIEALLTEGFAGYTIEVEEVDLSEEA